MTIKEPKHHRWLSHDKAITSLVKMYNCIVIDLEQNTVSGDPVGNWLLKQLKDPEIFRCVLLLADVLLVGKESRI